MTLTRRNKVFRLFTLLGAALPSALPSFAQAQTEQSIIERIDYICERGIVIPVTYIRNGEVPSVAVLSAEGKMIALQWHDSLKRYIAIDEQDSYRWIEENGQATLTHLEADHTAKEVTLLSACRADDTEE